MVLTGTFLVLSSHDSARHEAEGPHPDSISSSLLGAATSGVEHFSMNTMGCVLSVPGGGGRGHRIVGSLVWTTVNAGQIIRNMCVGTQVQIPTQLIKSIA